MSKYIHKSRNAAVLIYHLVFPAKYQRAVFDKKLDIALKEACLEIEKDIKSSLEVCANKDHIHFLIHLTPTYSLTTPITVIKSLTAREIFRQCLEVKKQLWGGEFWTDRYFASTFGNYGDKNKIAKYVKEQWGKYERLYTATTRVVLIQYPVACGWGVYSIKRHP